MVFLIAAVVYVVSNTIFVLFGSSEVQPWARQKYPKGTKRLYVIERCAKLII